MHDVLGLRRIRVELDNGMAARLIQKGPHTNPTPSTILQHILEFCRRDWEVCRLVSEESDAEGMEFEPPKGSIASSFDFVV
ncbi:hypothetical protein V6N11_079679 [Hibiscus sabdariffa]|uniref:Uncharacterized protein n=1 Tax=Hibiscus sabdariffa TaxID=183260 RepID=A0ABR2RWX9_9ROSI